MARQYAKVYERIWADADWRKLDADAQLLYVLLISQQQINHAGLLPLQERKWAACVANWDLSRVRDALGRLEHNHYVIVDGDTEELLVRTFIRNDENFRIPNALKQICRLAASVQSPLIRSALAAELGRLPALEGKKSEEGRALIRATRVALGALMEPIPEPMGQPIPEPMTEPMPHGLQSEPIPQPMAEPSVVGAGVVGSGTSVPEVGGEEPPAPPENADGPPLCKRHKHLERDDVPNCRRCADLRQDWEADHLGATESPPLPPLCGQCDNRWIETDRGQARCPRCHPSAARKATSP